MKKTISKILAVLLSLLTIISCFPATALTAGNSYAFEKTYLNAYYETGQWRTANGDYHENYGQVAQYNLKSTGEPIYCIQIYNGVDSSAATAKTIKETNVWKYELTDTAKSIITLVSIWGYPNYNYGYSKTNAQLATQVLIWEAETGARTSYSTGCSSWAKSIFTNYPDALSCYNEILKACQNHSAYPSFRNTTVTLKGTGETNAVTITDSNGVLSQFERTSTDSHINISSSGNNLKIWATGVTNYSGTITLSKKKTYTDTAFALTGAGQTLFYGTIADPISTRINVNVEAEKTCNVSVTKKSSLTNEVLDGASFKVQQYNVSTKTWSDYKTLTASSTNGSTKYTATNLLVTDDNNGWFRIVETKAPSGYTNDPKYSSSDSNTYTDGRFRFLYDDDTDGKTFNFIVKNDPKYGDLSISKTAEDGIKEGHRFHLYGISDIGIAVDEYAESNAESIVEFKNILVGTYTLEEIDTDNRYVVPVGQNIVIEWNKVTNAKVDNILKKFRVQVTKTDAKTVVPQGNASLAGAVYGMFNNGELVDTYTTDSKGSFTTKYYICGENWTLREISPSPGYLLDETVHKIGAEPKLYSVEFNTISLDVTEEPIYGSIALIKHTDDGSTQIETPEVGAEFEIFLKAAGSYAAARASERDIIVCDDFGFGKTKELPYGLYTVHQTKGWEGRELIADFDVYISQNGKVYPFLINNSSFESYVKIVKIDAETGKVIPYAGAGFQIYTPEGELITHTITYPTPTTIDTFYTNSEGNLITPETLPFGSGYSLVEVQAPYGYVLDSTPIYFDINQEDSTKEDTLTVIVVEKANVAQKGVIEITKTGEVFSSVKNSNDIYSPVFEVKGLAEATYEIYAYEDIVTLDGTVRAVAGELVDTVTTGSDGIGKSKPLYLGKYLAKEKIAPDTMVLNSEEYLVEFVYAGQEVEITSTALSVYNERQKVEISLSKVLEKDDLYGIGNNGEILAVQFGIFAAEEITATDGSVIPTDGLITFANCNENGKLIFDCDLPIGFKWYAKEIATDEHYILSDEKYEFDTVYQGQDIEVIDIRINDGEAIENALKRGSVQGIKVGENNEPLAGALIGIFAPRTTEFTEETAIATVVSAVDGSFAFEGVPYGERVVAEIKAPTGFVLDNTQHHVYISDDEVIINIKIENEKIYGNFELTKSDVSTGELLSDVGFRIYDEDLNIIAEGYTDENGKFTVENLVYGDYFYQEFSCSEAYVLDDALYPFSIRENGVTVKVEMTNRMKQGKLIILKIDPSDREKILEGVVFVIEDENGCFVAEITTDKTSIAEIELTYGKYVVYEKSTLIGYILDTTKHEIEITKDGEIIEITVENSRIPEDTPNVNTPYTGDNRNYGVVIGLCMIAFGAAVSAVILKINSKKAEDEN